MVKQKITDMSLEHKLALKNAFSNAVEQAEFEQETIAIYYGISLSLLQQWRCNGAGPKFKKIGRTILYQKSDVLDFFKQKYENTSQYQRKAS
ncbi:helix-turn-helix domain-containing protein [Acinetobacter ursingii]|uniref:helix-turn-helix domain-containing protein n=1 Tax=Acinetobacter ursingii TaxID=108980 RepID=UPI002447AA64|nr:DNA-binding protein [Acinetobacter ursingii]MDH2018878.1 helix-turn-helix domain-containing protein [Acinetobacter ursingii]MDH2071149.1 helix-turn-helix domain-containing protein [Acinetobacter ursingii]